MRSENKATIYLGSELTRTLTYCLGKYWLSRVRGISTLPRLAKSLSTAASALGWGQ